MNTTGLTLEKPTLEDSTDIYALVTRSKPLDINSRYAYMLVTTHFKQTSIVAKSEGKVVGFICGYILPEEKNRLFIWQVAVDESQRGKGLAFRLLESLLQRENLKNIEFLDTTINPSNTASKKLFEKIAQKYDAKIKNTIYFSKDLFAQDAHEDEVLFHIGPLHVT
jgi:L-2,4-diaminobutyric acid acetyltransferase